MYDETVNPNFKGNEKCFHTDIQREGTYLHRGFCKSTPLKCYVNTKKNLEPKAN